MNYNYDEVKEILNNIRILQTEVKKLKFERDEILNSGDMQGVSYEEKIKGYSEHIGIEKTIVKLEDLMEDIESRIMEKESLIKLIEISLGALDDIEKSVIVLGYFEGKNDTTIAYTINRTNPTVSLIRRRAIKKITKILNI